MTGTAQWATRVLDKLHQPEASPLACTSLVAGSVTSSSGLELEAGRANAPEQAELSLQGLLEGRNGAFRCCYFIVD